MKEKIKETIVKIAKDEGIEIHKIILFGSRARGEEKSQSDWDILVVVKKNINSQKRMELWYKIYSALRLKFKEIAFDIILKSKNNFEAESNIVNTISNEALSCGEIL